MSREVTKCPEESVQQCSNSLVVQTGPKTRRSTIGTICACVHALVCFHKILHMWTMLVQPADTVQTFSLLIKWTVTAAVSAAVCWANAWPAYTKSLRRNSRLLHAWHKSKYLHCRLIICSWGHAKEIKHWVRRTGPTLLLFTTRWYNSCACFQRKMQGI